MNVEKMRHQLERSYQHEPPCATVTMSPYLVELRAMLVRMAAQAGQRRHGPEGH